MNENYLLQPLRIPTGWKITYNMFMESDNPDLFTDEDSSIRFNFSEDILQIVNENIIIDLGWYPEQSVKGNYILSLIKDNDWEGPIYEIQTRRKEQIISKIEWLLIHAGELVNEKKNLDKYCGSWYCPVIKKEIDSTNCYELSTAGHGGLKKEALFLKVDLERWDYLCDRCTNNPDNR